MEEKEESKSDSSPSPFANNNLYKKAIESREKSMSRSESIKEEEKQDQGSKKEASVKEEDESDCLSINEEGAQNSINSDYFA